MTSLRLATRDDDALLRSLLRDNGMPSWVEMGVEREPSYFAGHGFHPRDWAVLAHDRERVVGMYAAAIARVLVDGQERSVGYLGGLRVQPAERHRIRHLRQGFASVPRLAPETPQLPWWFTVVAEGNGTARRLLEAGLPGLPRYRRLGGLCTLALARARGARDAQWRAATIADLPLLLEFHRAQAARYQLAPVLTPALVERVGLANFHLHEGAEGLDAMAALWDQSGFKQVVAHGYRGALRAARPLYNAFAALTRRVALPPVGRPLPQTFLAFAAFAPSLLIDEDEAVRTVRGLLHLCPTPVAAIGLHERHPMLPVLKRLAPLSYETGVYAVEFDAPAALEPRPVQPEVALL